MLLRAVAWNSILLELFEIYCLRFTLKLRSFSIFDRVSSRSFLKFSRTAARIALFTQPVDLTSSCFIPQLKQKLGLDSKCRLLLARWPFDCCFSWQDRERIYTMKYCSSQKNRKKLKIHVIKNQKKKKKKKKKKKNQAARFLFFLFLFFVCLTCPVIYHLDSSGLSHWQSRFLRLAIWLANWLLVIINHIRGLFRAWWGKMLQYLDLNKELNPAGT